MWFSTKEKEMYYFNPTAYPIQFYPFHLNKQLKSIHDKYQLIGHIKKFKKTDDHYDIRFHGTNGYLELYDSTHIKAVEINRFVGSNKYKTVELTIDSIRVYSKISIGILTTVINDQTHQRKQIFEISTSSYLTEDMYNIDKVIRTNDNIEILNGNNLFIVCADSIRLIPLEYVGLDMDHMPTNNHLFVATYNGFYQLDQQYNLIKKGLQNYTVSSVLIDKNNGLWFSTIESGIFYLKNYNINTLKFKDKQIPSNAVLFKNNLTLISSGKYQLFIYNKKLEQLHIVKDAIYTKRASIIVSADKKNLNYFKMDNHFFTWLKPCYFLVKSLITLIFLAQTLYM